MNIQEKLKMIDKYFDNLSVDEFERVLERNGFSSKKDVKIKLDKLFQKCYNMICGKLNGR